MSGQVPQRRLAAILVADVVGYSRMMQADEAGTLAALKSRRTEILQPLVSKHHGRIIKVMGDGVLVEFASAVHAVHRQRRQQSCQDHPPLHIGFLPFSSAAPPSTGHRCRADGLKVRRRRWDCSQQDTTPETL
ncbi:MAG TPA: adenylate/guanylate cyclase domain-containing protein [Gemmataceae bacterium]|nr:adenylate/guanylate cyclase domain-containing protein [Gemmataceae bacterium]